MILESNMTMIEYFCVLIEAWGGFKYQNPTRLAGYQKKSIQGYLFFIGSYFDESRQHL